MILTGQQRVLQQWRYESDTPSFALKPPLTLKTARTATLIRFELFYISLPSLRGRAVLKHSEIRFFKSIRSTLTKHSLHLQPVQVSLGRTQSQLVKVVVADMTGVRVCLLLPSNNCVSLVNQRDGQIQTVVGQFVLRICTTPKKERWWIISGTAHSIKRRKRHILQDTQWETNFLP